MPYTEGSRRNLLREGIAAAPDPRHRQPDPRGTRTSGAMRSNAPPPACSSGSGSRAAATCSLTAHRQETVDVEQRLRSLVAGVLAVAEAHDLPIVASVHPRTRSRLEAFGVRDSTTVACSTAERSAFFDFVALERNARCVLTDSGTVQEECCILRRSDRHSARHDRATRDGRVRQQRAERRRRGSDCAHHRAGPHDRPHLDAAARVHGDRRQQHGRAHRPWPLTSGLPAGPARGESEFRSSAGSAFLTLANPVPALTEPPQEPVGALATSFRGRPGRLNDLTKPDIE